MAREFSEAYDSGRLPNGGGFMDQPLRWDLLFRIYSGERGRLQRALMEKAKEKRGGSR